MLSPVEVEHILTTLLLLDILIYKPPLLWWHLTCKHAYNIVTSAKDAF